MSNMLLWIGRAAGVGGVLLCTLAGLVRISGQYSVGIFQVGTLLLVGIAVMIVGCLSFLAVLTAR